MNTKKDVLQKHKVQNQTFSILMNLQHYHNALKNQKKTVAVYFKDVKTEETFIAKNRS